MKSGSVRELFPLPSPDNVLAEMHRLAFKENPTHAETARVKSLGDVYDRMIQRQGAALPEDAETRNFSRWFRNGAHAAEARDMGITSGSGGSYLVPENFRLALAQTMRQYDALFDDDWCSVYRPQTGAPGLIPAADDVSNAGSIIAAGTTDSEVLPTIQQVALSAPPTFRSGRAVVSIELAQDSAFNLSSYFGRTFGRRLARAVSPTLVAALLAGSKVGATAVGSSSNTGGSETGSNSVGTDDLFAVMNAVDPAYLTSEKCGFLLNYPTLLRLRALRDRSGRLVLGQERNAEGRPMLLGFPVGICPTLANPAPSAVPILFGDFSYFLTRIVEGSVALAVDIETRAEYGQLTLRALLRADGTVLLTSTSNTIPIAALANAS